MITDFLRGLFSRATPQAAVVAPPPLAPDPPPEPIAPMIVDAPTAGRRPEPGHTPFGLRNNNPCNIRDIPGITWQGQVGVARGFCVYDSAQMGIRAAAKLLLTYERKYGLTTVEGIIGRWAPPAENDTQSYINAVSRALGVAPAFVIDLHNAERMTTLCRAIIHHENGYCPYSDEEIKMGVQLALVP